MFHLVRDSDTGSDIFIRREMRNSLFSWEAEREWVKRRGDGEEKEDVKNVSILRFELFQRNRPNRGRFPAWNDLLTEKGSINKIKTGVSSRTEYTRELECSTENSFQTPVYSGTSSLSRLNALKDKPFCDSSEIECFVPSITECFWRHAYDDFLRNSIYFPQKSRINHLIMLLEKFVNFLLPVFYVSVFTVSMSMLRITTLRWSAGPVRESQWNHNKFAKKYGGKWLTREESCKIRDVRRTRNDPLWP